MTRVGLEDGKVSPLCLLRPLCGIPYSLNCLLNGLINSIHLVKVCEYKGSYLEWLCGTLNKVC